MAEGTAAKLRVGAIEVPEGLIRRATQARTAATPTVQVSAPVDNPLYKIIFSASLTPEQQQAELAKYMTFAGTKEESKAAIKAYQEFEEWLQAERERMSRKIIELTDTETFAELQSVYNDLNNALLEFDEKMRPLSEIIDAIYQLRVNGKTMDAFEEIQSDKKNEAKRKQEQEQKDAEFRALRQKMTNLNQSIAALGEQRGWFGFGGVKEAAREQIAVKQVELQQAQADLDHLSGEIARLVSGINQESKLGPEFLQQKEKLRELLDISSDEHKQRQKELVDAALGFVNKAKTRIGSVREHLGKMTDQIDSLYDANTKMSGVYAVMTEGIKDASGENSRIREGFKPPEGEENLIAKMAREEKLGAVEDHIRALDTAAGSTIETFADLTSQTIRIRTMRDSNESQIDKARRMHSHGIAGVADRLSVVLNAVSAAALGESSAMAKDTLEGMTDRTNQIAQKEVIQVALGVREINRDIEKALKDLGDYGEGVRVARELWHEGLTGVHDNIERLRSLAEEVRGDVNDLNSVHADVAGGASPASKPGASGSTTGSASPFGS